VKLAAVATTKPKSSLFSGAMLILGFLRQGTAYRTFQKYCQYLTEKSRRNHRSFYGKAFVGTFSQGEGKIDLPSVARHDQEVLKC